MRPLVNTASALLAAITMTGCSGSGQGPGYVFEIILVVLPLLALLYVVVSRFDALMDSLFTIETKLDSLKEELEKLEERSANKGRKKK